MPELPEVESVRRGLARARLRVPIVEIWRSDKPLRIGENWRRENLGVLEGATPTRLGRRGKYLVWHFERAGTAPLGLLVHLGMTGKLELASAEAPQADHTHLVLGFADHRQVRFVDARRFGGLRAAPWQELRRDAPLSGLGPEPLSPRFDGDVLEEKGGTSRRVVRDVLLDQRVVAGVGNIYALEALFEAGVHPLQVAHGLASSQWSRLASAVQSVLRRAIRNGGTTFRDFRSATGRRGRNQAALWVYGRSGQPCRRCGATLQSFVHGGRSGAYCPREQWWRGRSKAGAAR